MVKNLKHITAVLSMLLALTNPLIVFAADTSPNNTEEIISIDAQIPTPETGKTLEEVFGDYPSPAATTMPTQTWDWNEGKYSGTFSIAYEYSYTQYHFTVL